MIIQAMDNFSMLNAIPKGFHFTIASFHFLISIFRPNPAIRAIEHDGLMAGVVLRARFILCKFTR